MHSPNRFKISREKQKATEKETFVCLYIQLQEKHIPFDFKFYKSFLLILAGHNYKYMASYL